jgi:uncharacterized membrane protein YqhA
MWRYLLPVRFVMLLASLGALLGAMLMFALAGLRLVHGAELLFESRSRAVGEITSGVMGATDAILFGVVLMIFAYAIAFGFVFQLNETTRRALPRWMHVEGVTELKRTLVEVTIVYLVVDFATDLALAEDAIAWQSLVKPGAIALIALALRLMTRGDERLATVPNAH